MPDSVGLADHVEAHWPGVDGVPVPWLLCALDAIVRKSGVDLIGLGVEQVLQELPGRLSVSRCNPWSDGELGCSVNAHKEIELAYSRLNLGNVPFRGLPTNRCRAADMKEADGVAIVLLALGLVILDIRQT